MPKKIPYTARAGVNDARGTVKKNERKRHFPHFTCCAWIFYVFIAPCNLHCV